MNKIKIFLILFAIIAFGLFLRIYNIENIPPGIYPDEAVNGEDALRANESGVYQWFYPANNGREGLFINLIALFFNYLGVSILTLKLPSIIFGTLTILGTYLLSKELFQNQKISLISSFLVAVSFWAINFSRISFRANMLPVILAFSFYFLWRGMRTKKWWDFAIGGIIFGLGAHSYISFRIAPLILVVMLVVFILNRKKFIQEYWKSILIFVFTFFLSASPMLYTFFVSNPEYLDSRSGSISILSQEVNQGKLIQTFLGSFSLSLLKYNFWGDQNWRHNFPPYAILDPLTGIAFIFGIIYSILRVIKLSALWIFKKSRNRELEIHLFLLSFFFLMLVPEFMTAEGNPHALRAIGTIPVVFIFSALTFNFLLEKKENKKSFLKKSALYLVIGSLIFIGIFNSIKYHIVWSKKEKTALSFNKNLTEISRYIKEISPEKEKYIITSYNTLEKIPIQIFHFKDEKVFYIYPNEIEKISPKNRTNFIIIFTEKNEEAISEIKRKFSYLKFEEIRNDPGSVFFVLK